MKLEELRKAIENYPELLAKAIADVAKAEQAVERLEEKIAEEEDGLLKESVKYFVYVFSSIGENAPRIQWQNS